MPLQEIEESELNVLKQSKAFIDRLAGDPRTRGKVNELIKIINPNAVIPELDAKNEVLAEVAKAKKELEDFKKQIAEEKEKEHKSKGQAELDAMIEKGRTKLKADGYTDEGITGIEKLMNTRGIADYEAAAALFEKEQPKEEAVTPTDFGKSWNLAKPEEGDEDHKLLMKDPQQFQAKQIRKFMAEQRVANGGRR